MKLLSTIALSLPPELTDKIDELMKEEGRTRSELPREVLRKDAEGREWRKIYRHGEARVRQKGIKQDQIEDLIDAR